MAWGCRSRLCKFTMAMTGLYSNQRMVCVWVVQNDTGVHG